MPENNSDDKSILVQVMAWCFQATSHYVAFLIFFSIIILSPYFLKVGLLLQSVALFQSRELVKYLE